MKGHFFFIFLIALICSCTANQAIGLRGFDTRQSEQYYLNSGVVQYFLSELPAWANSYQDGSCLRKSSIRYLDLKSLRESYRYSYSDALQFQYLFNEMKRERMNNAGLRNLRPQDEELVFFETSNRIQSSFYPFRRPEFNQVSLIWIDPLLKAPKNTFSKLLEREDVLKGHPVAISNCLTGVELRSWLNARGISNENIRLIPAEMFSPYDDNSDLTSAIHINVKDLFSFDQKINFYIPKNMNPSTIEGKFSYKFY